MTQHNYIQQGLAVIDIEVDAVQQLKSRLDHRFQMACELMHHCQGRIVVTGMGKSGHIGGKIAATLASTGSPAFFVHPGEASHGDLGMLKQDDVVLALSNSGETAEIVTLLPIIKRFNIPLISMTGNAQSTLALAANVNLDTGVTREACPLGLAPTSSTTTALVMGDALAVALLQAKGFTENDFALSHPGGSLGKRLLLHVEDVMHQGEALPLVAEHVNIKEALLEISSKGLGMTGVINAQGQLIGLYTDGDLRRTLDRDVDLNNTPITAVMTHAPKTIDSNILAAQALQIMEAAKINGLFILDKQTGHPMGALNMHDLLRAGVV